MYCYHVFGGGGQCDGADCYFQDEGYAQQYEYLFGESECGRFDGVAGVHADRLGGGEFQAGDVGVGRRTL